MLEESLHWLRIQPNGVYLDATLGGGGHTRAILERLDTGCVVGVDQDDDAIREAGVWGAAFGGRFQPVQTNFENLVSVLDALPPLDGALFDLGVSSHQLDTADRGFSFREDGPLDMRMHQGLTESAADWLQSASEAEIAQILREYGEERMAGRIARALFAARDRLETTTQLADVVRRAVPKTYEKGRIHPATRTFQALRIVVNREMDVLPTGLDAAIRNLRPGGRIVVIAYHSLEDRIVKNLFRDGAVDCVCPPRMPVCHCGHKATLKVLTRKPETPTEAEIARNSRARSAKLRAAERLPDAQAIPA